MNRNLREWSGELVFSDVGAIVYYVKAIPWLVPGFSVRSHASYLQRLQVDLDTGKPLAFTMRLYLIEARQE